MSRRRYPLPVLPHVGASMLLLMLLLAPCASAGEPQDADAAPSPPELARMILHGNDAEQALVARWLEDAERADLLAVFRALRALRAVPQPVPVPAAPALPPPVAAAKQSWAVMMDVRVLDVPVERATDVLGACRPTPEATRHHVSAEAVDRLLERVEAGKDIRLVSAPRLTTFDRQRANVSVVDQVSYVKDFDVVVGADGAVAVDPIIGTVQDGLLIELLPVVAASGAEVTVFFEGIWSTLFRPIPDFVTDLDGKKVTIQLPEVRKDAVKTEVLLRDGGYVMLGGGTPIPSEEGSFERVVLLHVHLMALDFGKPIERR